MDNSSQPGKESGVCQPAIAANDRECYSATASIPGVPYEFPCVLRTVGKTWACLAHRTEVVERFKQVCRGITAYRFPKGKHASGVIVGPCRGDFDRKPDLIFVSPIVEQQLAECLVDATVNPGAFELNQLIGQWNGSWHLMARVCVRAILHPVLREFEQRHDFKAALTIRFSTGLPKWKHESQIQKAGKILHEVHEAIRMGIESDFLIGIVGFWWSMEPQKARDVGVLLTAIDIFVRAYPDQAVESLKWNAADLSERIRLN